MSNGSLRNTAFKKKLYACRPCQQPAQLVEASVSAKRTQRIPGDPVSLERAVRQCLADKINGNLAGIWLLVAEHLRLGTWDLLCGWTGQPTERVEPRLGL